LDYAVFQQFIQQGHRDMILVEQSPDKLLDRISKYQAPFMEKWVRPKVDEIKA